MILFLFSLFASAQEVAPTVASNSDIYSLLEVLGVPASVMVSIALIIQQARSQVSRFCQEANEFKKSFDQLSNSVEKISKDGLLVIEKRETNSQPFYRVDLDSEIH